MATGHVACVCVGVVSATEVAAYAERGLDYMDLCDPKLVHQEPPLFWGFWGQCFNDYRHRLAFAAFDGS